MYSKSKMSQHAGTGNAKEVGVRRSRTTILDLNENCWIEVMKYLNVKDQLRLASSNLYIGAIFERYASRRYKRINDSITEYLDDKELKQLLQIVGEHLVRYECDFAYSRLSSDQQLGLLRSHCPNIEHLRMTFVEGFLGSEWDNLYSLTTLKSLDASLKMEKRLCSDFVNSLKQFTCLRKLKLKAQRYSGNELYALDQLESLEVRECVGFDDKNLEDCCQTMKQLRELKLGFIENLSKNTVEILVKNCQQLERLVFRARCLDSIAHELFCQLPRLKHLQLTAGSVSDSFIEGLINKQGAPLESFTLYAWITKLNLKHICDISSLKELRVYCDTVPLEHLLKLKNLRYLHISMPITTDQILILLTGLPHLKVLNLLCWDEKNNAYLVSNVRTWVEGRWKGKIKIVLSDLFYSDFPHILYADPMVEVRMDSWFDPILINKELGERDQN